MEFEARCPIVPGTKAFGIFDRVLEVEQKEEKQNKLVDINAGLDFRNLRTRDAIRLHYVSVVITLGSCLLSFYLGIMEKY